MRNTKTLICELRENGDRHFDESLLNGTKYRVIYGDDQIIESTTSPLSATASALSARGHVPDTLFALRSWGDGAVRCVVPIGQVNCGPKA